MVIFQLDMVHNRPNKLSQNYSLAAKVNIEDIIVEDIKHTCIQFATSK
jgi:hypothetical protein